MSYTYKQLTTSDVPPLQARQSQERASVTLANILNKLDEFTGRANQHDNITCLVVSRFFPSTT